MWSWKLSDAQEQFSLEIHVISVLLGICTLLRYLSILVSVTLLSKEVGGFDYKLYEEPCPLWCGADS